jgi:hypothetical protein
VGCMDPAVHQIGQPWLRSGDLAFKLGGESVIRIQRLVAVLSCDSD